MYTNDHSDRTPRSPEDGRLRDRYDSIRTAVRRMDADAVARQLPNLAETVASVSRDDRPTRRFLIGISFSKNDTLLDYRLDRLLDVNASGGPGHETLKPAVSPNHRYLTFAYPPDPHFDATTLRGALLGAIEGELSGVGWTRGDSGREAGDDAGTVSWFHHLRRQFVGPL